MAGKKIVARWQVEFERPFRGVEKAFGKKLVHDNRIFKLYLAGTAVATLDETIAFPLKVSKDTNGNTTTMVQYTGLENAVRDGLQAHGRDFLLFEELAENDILTKSRNGEIEGMNIESFSVDQIAYEIKFSERRTLYKVDAKKEVPKVDDIFDDEKLL